MSANYAGGVGLPTVETVTDQLARRVVLRGAAGASVLALAGCSGDEPSGQQASTESENPTPSPTPSPTTSTAPPTTASPTESPSSVPRPQVAGTVVDGIGVPWGIAFLPDGTALVGARDSGDLFRVGDGGTERVATLDVRSRIDEGGETGLLGLALHPQFATNRLLYAYLSTDDDNRVVRMQYDGTLGRPEPVLTGIATSTHHNGGGLVFGPDGLLYASTGDAEDSASAQDTDSVNGKVLRMTDTGEMPDGNPFGNLVWSYGHRNVEGLCFDQRGFDDQSQLCASEFGDKGADELNLIRPGKNYGWPEVEGSDGKGGYVDPLAEWPVDQCSPSGIAIAAGRAWLGALQGECVWSVVLDGPKAGQARRYFTGEYGRIRSVALAPDGSLWVTTSNRDGRTDPRPGDDRILRVTL
jgi:glucose/arabinose dehydrogenase